ncbi:hypothetical protein [Defluviitalea phaphyphila]|uniref:hypothetical protein n=1 Tax=Defluviitalea phaphyphila TaxID=1473580 RepID=UPI00072FB326|nr:hypothetical protein [Defluviitalea phaphyphila]
MDKNKDVLKNLDPEMIKETQEVINNLKGKSNQEIMEELIKLSNQKKQSGKKLTKEQSAAILQAMKECLPPNKRKQFEAMVKLMEMMNK